MLDSKYEPEKGTTYGPMGRDKGSGFRGLELEFRGYPDPDWVLDLVILSGGPFHNHLFNRIRILSL